jgi:hypothetical protein
MPEGTGVWAAGPLGRVDSTGEEASQGIGRKGRQAHHRPIMSLSLDPFLEPG